MTADHHVRMDRPLGAERTDGGRLRHLRHYGGIHAMQDNLTGTMGLADYLGW